MLSKSPGGNWRQPSDIHASTAKESVVKPTTVSSHSAVNYIREEYRSVEKEEHNENCPREEQTLRKLGRTLSLNGARQCHFCNKKVYAPELLHIMSRYYHRTCFRCTRCNRLLDIGRYSVHEKVPYCLPHYDWLIKSGSNTNITRKTVHAEDSDKEAKENPPTSMFNKAEALGANDQSECNSSVQPAGWEQNLQTFEQSSNPKQPRCHTCGRLVQSCQVIVLPDKVFHPDCAKCFTCQIALSTSSYRDFQGKIYCAPHYAQAVAEFRESRRRTSSLRSSGRRQFEFSIPLMQMRTPVMVGTSSKQLNPNSWEKKPTQELPTCVACNELTHPNTSIPLDGRFYHFDCLQCHLCGRHLSKFDHKELDGKVYCSKDYAAITRCMGAPKTRQVEMTVVPSAHAVQTSNVRINVENTYCYACANKVYATESLHAMNRIYHKQCFKCKWCHSTLGVENYHVHNKEPYCKPHYRQLFFNKAPHPIQNKSAQSMQLEHHTCRTCQEIVQPRDCIQILQQYYHYNCFRCEHCSEILTMGKFEMAHGKPYCPTDFVLLFGRHKGVPSRQSPLQLNGFVRSQSMDRRRQNATAETHQHGINPYCYSTVTQINQ